MSATDPRPAAENRLARFRDLVPYQSQHKDNGIPSEVMEFLAAHRVFPVLCPPGLVGRNAMAPLRGWPGLCISIAQCTPNQGPVSHNHTGTLETFLCLDGRFDVMWGNELEHKVTLEPGDICSVPPNVYRTFRNLTNDNARLFVLIQGDEKMSDKIEMLKAVGEGIRKDHGEKVVALLDGINMRFQGEPATELAADVMPRRVTRAGDVATSEVQGERLRQLMSADRQDGAAIECWPGMKVAFLDLAAGQSSEATLADDHCQWVFSMGNDQPGTAALADAEVELHKYDIVRVAPGSRRKLTNNGSGPLRLILVTQERKTASLDRIQADARHGATAH